MSAFTLAIGDSVAYDGLHPHAPGRVVGIDYYGKVKDEAVVKQWASYTITSSSELAAQAQMERGLRWWITWDGVDLREWVYVGCDAVDDAGPVIEDFTGAIRVEFEGDCGVSTSQGHLFVYGSRREAALWHSREEFLTASGEKEVICFHSRPIVDRAEIGR